MTSELLPYYEHELLFIRKMASEFAQRYPDRAAALKLSGEGSEDPHVERLMEAFALIAGRIQRKIDDEFPEITEALLDVLYPHYLRPVPSMTIAQFEVDPELGKLATGYPVARGTTLYTAPVNGAQCRFRTCYPVHIWPLTVVAGAFLRGANIPGGLPGSASPYAIRIEMQLLGGAKFEKLEIQELRFFLGGDSQAAHTLYEVLLKNVNRIVLRFPGAPGKKRSVVLSSQAIREVGFGIEEAMLPYSDRSFQGYRLLQEYFSFPQKFLFFDLLQLSRLPKEGLNDRLEILILLNEFQRGERVGLLEQAVNRDTFQLGCTPVVNLFERCAEPIRISHTKTEYNIVPDIHFPDATEVYAVNRVTSVSPYSEEPTEYKPFYSFRHAEDALQQQQAFWCAARRASERAGDAASEVFLSLVDLNFKPSMPPVESLTAHVTCTNRDLPGRLPFRGTWGELDTESGPLMRVRALYPPTKTLRPPLRRGVQWRLISHLALNHLSIVDGGLEALQELLSLYDVGSSPVVARQIMGIASIQSARKIARLNSEYGSVFCQGIEVDAEFDEDQYAGSGVFLLASVLEKFFGLYSSVNSFTQLRVTTRQRKGVVWQWAPRAGEQIVL